MPDMLDLSLEDYLRPMNDFHAKLRGENGHEYWEGFKRFLRKENPWQENLISQINRARTAKSWIDLAANPFVPNGWTVEKHHRGQNWQFDPKKVELYLSQGQQQGRTILGRDLRTRLKDKAVLNANVLDWLLKKENLHLIPEEWKDRHIFFWGTIYRDNRGKLYVRYLYWGGTWWGSSERWLGSMWEYRQPAALAA